MTPFGVYVHIPFCRAKCDYCAFATWVDRHHLTDAYVESVREDIRMAIDNGMPAATSVFVGGGHAFDAPGRTAHRSAGGDPGGTVRRR